MHTPIPCLHETGVALNSAERVDDHHPLTKQQVAEILEAAATERDYRIVAGYQCRLGQGVIGNVCPHVIDGPVSMRRNIIDHLFVDLRQLGADPVLVDVIWHAMRAGDAS